MQSRVKFYVFSFLISGLALCGFSTVIHAKAPDFLIQEDDVVRGDPKAPITILEYSDFTCGFCEKFFHETFPQLLSQYIETGKVRFVYRDFPVPLEDRPFIPPKRLGARDNRMPTGPCMIVSLTVGASLAWTN